MDRLNARLFFRSSHAIFSLWAFCFAIWLTAFSSSSLRLDAEETGASLTMDRFPTNLEARRSLDRRNESWLSLHAKNEKRLGAADSLGVSCKKTRNFGGDFLFPFGDSPLGSRQGTSLERRRRAETAGGPLDCTKKIHCDSARNEDSCLRWIEANCGKLPT